jgi:hypothetical protein
MFIKGGPYISSLDNWSNCGHDSALGLGIIQCESWPIKTNENNLDLTPYLDKCNARTVIHV